MSQQTLKLKVIGIPHIPSITEINARPDAGTNGDVAFKIPVGTTDVVVIEVKEDLEKKNLDGKVYHWFRAEFPQGVGWVRDDLVEIWGDGTAVGYPNLLAPTFAHTLTRDTSRIAHGAETQSPTASSEVSSTPTASSEVSSTPTASSEVSSTPTASSEVSSTPTASSEVSSEPAPSAPMGPGKAVIMASPTGKLRPGPGTGHNPPAIVNYGDVCDVIEARMGDDGIALNWVKIRINGNEGWMREDLVRLSGNFAPFGLNAPDKYPNPTDQSRWIRGFDKTGRIWFNTTHDGWDHAGNIGDPLLAGPQGGVVYKRADCSKCGPQGLSTEQAGIPLYHSSIYTDPGWNGGYGHYVIIGYENSKLPQSTQDYLVSEGRAGQHIFVMYAHCQELLVHDGDVVAPNQQIAKLGNSGMSTGAHLHLEVRISPTMSPGHWAQIKDGLRSPGILFLR